jgi:hypothetical protein
MNHFRNLIAALMLVVLAACGNDEDPSSPIIPTGGISGNLVLSNEFGTLLPSHAGMKITAVSAGNDITNDFGNFQINGLLEGTYTLVYEKSGFGTFKKFNIPVLPQIGNGVTQLAGMEQLGPVSTTIVTHLAVALNVSDSTLTISCNVAPNASQSNPRTFRLFFGSDSNVSSTHFDYAPSTTWTATTVSGSILGFQPGQLYTAGLQKGTNAYVIAYGESDQSNTYFDPDLNRQIYPNLNLAGVSNTVMFNVP